MKAARTWRASLAALALVSAAAVQADALASLKSFNAEVKSGRGSFTQVVTSVDGLKKKSSSGTFEFQRPAKFRFSYSKPFEQLIVSDGNTVWIYDPDLQQASARAVEQALKGTPAAILAGGDWEQDFALKPGAGPADAPSAEGLAWLEALPKRPDGPVKRIWLGFKGKGLIALDVTDSFGQRSTLRLNGLQLNPVLGPDVFRFQPPLGVDVIQ